MNLTHLDNQKKAYQTPHNGVVRKQTITAVSKLNRENWAQLKIHKVKFEDAQCRTEFSIKIQKRQKSSNQIHFL